MLKIAYNSLTGGTCLAGLELRRNDEVYLNALGAQRITAIADNLLGGSAASYAYAGLSRRVSCSLGNGVTQSYRAAGESGYAGLDRFGRVADLHHKDSANGLTLRRDQYGYDRAGNRVYDRVTQRRPNVANQTWDNVRSWLYEYDGLGRLVDARMGRLDLTDPANPVITDPNDGTVPLLRKLTWDLDALSNWSGDPAGQESFLRAVDTDNDPEWGVI